MKNNYIIFSLLFLIMSCNLSEKKAIEICQKAKPQTDGSSLNIFNIQNANKSWLDYANRRAEESSNSKFEWLAKKTKVNNIYLVSFVDENKWGNHWEVNIEENIVKNIDVNEYLCRKYGFSRLDYDQKFFQITNIEVDTLISEKYNKYSDKGISYVFKAYIKNKSGTTLTEAKISATLQLIFKDKTIENSNSIWDEGFHVEVSRSNPWLSGTERSFYLKTNGIDPIYLDYKPEYIFFSVGLMAKDPIGFSYNKDILEKDLKKKWYSLRAIKNRL